MIWSDRALIAVLARLLPVRRAQNHDGSLSGTRDTQIPSASAFGALVTTDSLGPHDAPANRPTLATSAPHGHRRRRQPSTLCQIPESIDREQSAARPADVGITMAALLPTGQHPLMTFRIGHSTATALRSPRRPADHVLLP
jgi:hypothetical protein